MARRRGFLAELQHQNQVAARQQAQAARNAARAQAAAQRRFEQAQRQAERARHATARAAAAEATAANKEAQRLFEEAKVAETAALTVEVTQKYQDIDGLLAEAVRADPQVDLQSLRPQPKYPPFPRPDLERTLSPPPAIPLEPEPVFIPAPAPTGITAVFGAKRKHEQLTLRMREQFDLAHAAWRAWMAQLPARRSEQDRRYQQAEAHRQSLLEQARAAHQAECDKLRSDINDANKTIDRLISDLELGHEYAVQEYLTSLSNNFYPDLFTVEHDVAYDADAREATITVLVPLPESLPTEREFRWVKSRSEIASSALPKADQRQRYANAVYQVALRTLYVVFEGESKGWTRTVSLTVAIDGVDPAIGQIKRTVFVRMAADRQAFGQLNLANVVPLATLQHLGADASKNPFDRVGLGNGPGVRRL